MEYAIGYMVSVFAFQALAAWRMPREEFLVGFACSVFWPIFLLLIIASFALDSIGWDFDVARSSKIVGFRKPTNPAMKGFGITLFKCEFQLYKAKA